MTEPYNVKINKNNKNNLLEGQSQYMWEPSYFGLKNDNTGSGVRISIISTGVSSHKDLKFPEDFENFSDSETCEDLHGHSSLISGIICGNNDVKGVYGLAPNAKIIYAKAINDNGNSNSSSIQAAILWSIIKKADIILLPFEFNSTSDIAASIKKAFHANISVIAPLGKKNHEKEIFPFNFSEVLPVTDYKNNFEHCFRVNCPTDSVTTFLKNSYSKVLGLNSSAAIAAGLASLIIEDNKDREEEYTSLSIYRELILTNKKQEKD